MMGRVRGVEGVSEEEKTWNYGSFECEMCFDKDLSG